MSTGEPTVRDRACGDRPRNHPGVFPLSVLGLACGTVACGSFYRQSFEDGTELSGNITVDGVSGKVQLATSNGDVIGQNLAGGGTRIKTSSRDIDLGLREAQDARISAGSGGVDNGQS